MSYHTPQEPSATIKKWIVENYLYNSESGEIRHKKSKKPISGANKAGYLMVQYYRKGINKNMSAAHACWFLFYGVWPKQSIDHINRIKTDNRICNLREVSHVENSRNSPHFINASYVTFNKKSQKYQAQPCLRGKQHYLGLFATEVLALKAVLGFFRDQILLLGG